MRQKGGAIVKFDGFRGPDYESLNKLITGVYGLTFPKEELSTKGWHWGEIGMTKQNIQFMVGDKRVFDLPLNDVNAATLLKDDVQLFFPPQADATGVTPSLVELRFSFPEDGKLKGEQGEDQSRPDPVTDARFFQELVMSESDAAGGSDPKITSIEAARLALPRGRFDVELYPRYAKLVGSNPYRIPYENVVRMHHLPSAKGDASVSFVISMDPPIRRGQTVYNHVIMELPTDDHISVELELTDEQLNKYQGQLNREMRGKPSSLIARLFKVLTGKKVTIPGGSFKSSTDTAHVPCSVGAQTGNLYMLERSMFFIDKPAIMIPYDYIEQVEFQRHSQITSNRNFDLEVKLKPNRTVLLSGRAKSSVIFSHIAREERAAFVNMLRQKDIELRGLREERDNVDDMLDSDDEAPRRAMNLPPGEEDSEHDSSFGSEGSSSSDALEYASKASSDSDSDAGAEAPKKKIKAAASEAEAEDDDGEEDDE